MKIQLTRERRGLVDPALWDILIAKYEYEEFDIADLVSLNPYKLIEFMIAMQCDLDIDMAVAFASSVLPVFEKKHPELDVCRKALTAIAKFEQGKISKDDMLDVYYDVRATILKIDPRSGGLMADLETAHAYNAINAICYAAGAVYSDPCYKYSFLMSALTYAAKIAKHVLEVENRQREIIKRHFEI